MIKDVTFLMNRHFKFINPILCGCQKCNAGHSYGPAIREYWLLHYVVSGKGVFICGNQTFSLSAGQCFIIRPFEETVYIADSDDPWEYVWVGFSSEIELPEIFYGINVFKADNCNDVFLEIKKKIDCSVVTEEFIYGKLFELFAIISTAEKSEVSGIDRITATAKSIISAKYHESLTIAQIAESLHLDRTYFSTVFKRSAGVSPQEYLINYRLNMAARLLSSYGYSSSQAAAAVGYCDPLNFSRMFTKRYGMSPTAYKKAAGKLV